jgi:hypothetical protein
VSVAPALSERYIELKTEILFSAMSLQSAGPGHQPWTVPRLVGCDYLRVRIWSRGAAAFSRAGAGVFHALELLSLRPFPKSAVLLFIEIAMAADLS